MDDYSNKKLMNTKMFLQHIHKNAEEATETIENLINDVEEQRATIQHQSKELEFYKTFQRSCANCDEQKNCDVPKLLKDFNQETFVCTSWERDFDIPLQDHTKFGKD